MSLYLTRHHRHLPFALALAWALTFSAGQLGAQTPAAPPNSLGLLLVAHGAPREAWNKPILDLGTSVEKALTQIPDQPFARVWTAFLEFTQPSVAEAVKAAERAGVKRLLVLPLFVAPSGHTFYDLPTLLGLHVDEQTVGDLAKEGEKPVHPHLSLTLGPTLAELGFVQRYVARQVQALSSQPDSEAVVLLGHGDRRFAPFWEDLFRRAGAVACARTGISYYDYASVEVGQRFLTDGVETIQRAAQHRPRVLVLGLYVNLSAQSLARRFQDKLEGPGDELRGLNVVFSEATLVSDPELPAFLARQAVKLARLLP